MFCPKCGTQNPDNAVFCGKCGNKFISVKSENESQNSYNFVENSTHEKKQEPEEKTKLERKGITGKLGKMGIPGFRSGKPFLMILASLGYLFIIMILLASISPNNSDKNVSPSTPQVKTSPASQTIAKVGDKVIAGDFAYTFNSITTSKQISEAKKADGIFIILDVTIENIAKESKTILIDSYIKIIDDQGRTFNRDAMAGIYLGDEAFTFTQLQPGLPKRGKIVFDVPENINGKIELSTGLWSSDKKYILLTSDQTKAPTPQVGSYEKPASLGTMIADDTAEFTVLEVNKDSRQSILTTNQYRDDVPTGYKFDLLNIRIKNIGTNELTVSSYYLIKIFANGVEVKQAIMDSPTQFPEFKGGTIMPGSTMTGWIVATVPINTDYLVQYKSNMFNSVGGWVQVSK